MPIYEFHCGKCGKDSELLVPSTDWEGTECPECGSTKLEKKLSVFSASVAQPEPSCCGPDACGSCCMRDKH